MVRSRKVRGFTLLELIIVLAVLAALAALVVPILGWVREQSKYATAAAGAAEALNNLEIYKGATGRYPDRFDSLVNTSGAVFSKLYEASGGTFVYGSVVSAGPGYNMYNGGGPRSLMQHTEPSSSTTDPNTSTDTGTPVDLYVPGASTAPTVPMLAIDSTLAVSPYNSKAKRIVRTAFPAQADPANPTIPTGHQLIALGIGSRVSSIGTTMTSAPVHAGAQPGVYSRYIAVFDVSSTSGRGKVVLKMVLDSEFEVVATNVSNYGKSGPTDDAGAAPSGS